MRDVKTQADEAAANLLTTILARMDRQERNIESRMDRQEQQPSYNQHGAHRNRFQGRDQYQHAGDAYQSGGQSNQQGNERTPTGGRWDERGRNYDYEGTPMDGEEGKEGL